MLRKVFKVKICVQLLFVIVVFGVFYWRQQTRIVVDRSVAARGVRSDDFVVHRTYIIERMDEEGDSGVYYEALIMGISNKDSRLLLQNTLVSSVTGVSEGGTMLRPTMCTAERGLPGRSCLWSFWQIKCVFYNSQERPNVMAVKIRNVIQHLPTERRSTLGEKRIELAVCTGHALYAYGDWPQLVQFIEMWRTQGATAFVISVASVASEVQQILQAYQKENLVDVWTWGALKTSEGFTPNDKIRFYAQTLLASVCLAHFTGVAKRVVVVDTDEMIIANDASRSVNAILQSEPALPPYIEVPRPKVYSQPSEFPPDMLDPSNLDFQYLAFLAEADSSKRPKVIAIPDCVQLFQGVHRAVHVKCTKEVDFSAGERLHVRFIHLTQVRRRKPDRDGPVENNTSPYMLPLIKQMNASFKEIVRKHLRDAGQLSTYPGLQASLFKCRLTEEQCTPPDYCIEKQLKLWPGFLTFEKDFVVPIGLGDF